MNLEQIDTSTTAGKEGPEELWGVVQPYFPGSGFDYAYKNRAMAQRRADDINGKVVRYIRADLAGEGK